jgi:hypothetical protein
MLQPVKSSSIKAMSVWLWLPIRQPLFPLGLEAVRSLQSLIRITFLGSPPPKKITSKSGHLPL